MAKKCPNCGYQCNENDAYCAMCGVKLPETEENFSDDKNEIINESTDATIENIESFFNNNSDNKSSSASELNFSSKPRENSFMSFIALMLFVSLVMSGVLYSVIQSQNSKKLEMRYKNIIANPALIPELKEPDGLLDFKLNLKNCEEFLTLYLKYSNDSVEKKEQVFISYLKEMDKMPHMTNENLLHDNNYCLSLKTSLQAKKCAKVYNDSLKDVGIFAYSNMNSIYLYPDYKYIYNNYSKYLSGQMSEYIKLRAKYSKPTRVGLVLQIPAKKIADKIYDFEKLYANVNDVYIRDEILKTIYYDFRAFIFTPSIYATTTQEMTKEFKNAYKYFINRRKNSQLRPILMSYLDKMKSYNDVNFASDYPYKIFDDNSIENVENSSLSDIFAQLRKNAFSHSSSQEFTYVYSIISSAWKNFDKNNALAQGEYIFSTADSNNNISIFNNTFSMVQELSLPKYTKLFLANNSLYAFNSDRLCLYKVLYNGRNFSLQQLNITDASTVFPGIQVINLDSYQNYNIYLEKDNQKAAYIILSRYSQGFDGYKLSPLHGQISVQSLPNMFAVASDDEIIVSFHYSNINSGETSDNTPTYKIIIRTSSLVDDNHVVNYDEKTALEETQETHKPTIMPKIMKDNDNLDDKTEESPQSLTLPPKQNIDPPEDD